LIKFNTFQNVIYVKFSASFASLQCHMILQKSLICLFGAYLLITVLRIKNVSGFFDEDKIPNNIHMKYKSFVTLKMFLAY